MSQSATPATQNDMTTCLETFEKERFCSFPHRHGDATGKPETRDETRGRSKTSISCEISSNFDTFDMLSNRLECHKVPRLPRKTTWQPAWKPSKRRGFAASRIDTELTIPDDDPTTTRCRPDDDPTRHSRRTRVQPPDPQTINGGSFATQSGKRPCLPVFLASWQQSKEQAQATQDLSPGRPTSHLSYTAWLGL